MTEETTNADPEELLNQSRNQRRTSTEATNPDAGAPTGEASEAPRRAEAIADAFDDLKSGELNSTVAFRDERLAALLVGLERAGDLEDVIDEATAAVDSDADVTVSRSAAARLLVRVGIDALDADLWEDCKQGYTLHHEREAERL